LRQDFSRDVELDENEASIIVELFENILRLEKEGKNRIWTRIIKNSFAPFFVGEFDYVVGNPPWINWENLPEDYRNSTRKLWEAYGLLKKTKGMGLGKVKRDMAMLFVARCMDRYVRDGGTLSFLIPFTVYKTQAGAGFRRHVANYNIRKVHDLVTLYPFEGAINRTSLIVIQKAGKTKFPISCIMWHNPSSSGIDQEAELEEVRKSTRQFDLIIMPIEANKPESPWMAISQKAYEGVRKAMGESPWYRAYEGVNTALNQVYWVKVLSEQLGGLLITNPPLSGQKKVVKQIKQVVEKKLVYPLVRGRNVKKWFVEEGHAYILLPVDEKGSTLPHSEMKIKYPKTWEYFFNFFEDLVRRGGQPYKSKLKPYREKKFNVAEKIVPPFYWLFNVAPSLSPYKVVWKYVAGKISGKAEFSTAVLEPIVDRFLGLKIVIPNEKLMLIPLRSRQEAYYVCGVLNSSISQLLVASYVIETAISTHVTKIIKIPKFDPKDPRHQKILELSMKAYEIAKKIYEENREDLRGDLEKVEEEIDKAVAELYGITDDELKEIRKCLRILKEGEISEEGEIEEVITVAPPEVFVETPVLYEDGEQELTLKVVNHYDKPIKDVKVKLVLEDKSFEKTFEELVNEARATFRLPGLKTGAYQATVSMEYFWDGSLKKVEKVVPIYVKRSSESKVKRGSLDELLR